MASFELCDVTLSYPVYGPRDKTVKTAFREMAAGGLIQRTKSGAVEIRALKGVNLSAREGDRIGVIGHNGAGKTSLLKVLAGIYKPQTGSILRTGRTAAVINPSIGLDSGRSGYENIEIIGLLSGLTQAEIRAHVPDIAAFTELGDFLSLPVETYSTGMRTRLAFGVATSLRPEILIADENLATGDAGFMKRARDRMEAMMERSSLIVVASHSVATLKRLCNRAVLLDHGEVIADGPINEVLEQYEGMGEAE